MSLNPALLGALAIAAPAGSQVAVATPTVAQPRFERQVLTARYHSEGCAVGHVDRDGVLDVVSGPFWYRGPDYRTRREIRPPRTFPIGMYADEFLVWVEDVDADGLGDVVSVAFPGTGARWWRNPGQTGAHLAWPVALVVGMEATAFVDLDGDGARDLLSSANDQLTWWSRDANAPTAPWTPHILSPLTAFPTFTHGLGIGDVNGDGRRDVVTAIGWFEQPPSLVGDPPWPGQAFAFGFPLPGGAQIEVRDIDADGDTDVVTSLNAHGYGLSWYEHVQPGGTRTFTEHVIRPTAAVPGDPDQFSQLHALAMADVDGDGHDDVITGKTFFAHNGADPGALDPVVLYAFLWRRDATGVRFVPERIDTGSGVGRQVVARDLDGDGDVDIVVGNKKGVFVFRNRG